MINKIIRFAVTNRNLVFVLTFLFMVAGWLSFKRLSIDALPDVTNVQVTISAFVEGMAPEETERYVTIPIENAMNGIAGVAHVRSLTKFGLSQITVTFEDGTDIFRARQQVAEHLQPALGQLPSGVQPKLGPITTGLGEIFHYRVEADHIESGEARIKQLMELRSIQEWQIRPRLLTVKGVAEVDTIGGYEKQYHIQPDPEKMAKYKIGFDDIAKAMEATNKNVGGGYIQQSGKQYLVQAVGLLSSPEEIKKVPVKSLETFQTITIGDIADVDLASELRVGAATIDGREAIIGTVNLLTGENSRTVATRVAEKLGEIKQTLPPGTKIEKLYNRAELVNTTLHTVLHNLLLGAGFVIVILLLLIGNLRAALITAFIIPLSLLFTFLIMDWRGVSGNLVSLGALDFGIIVDGAVIVLDNCVRFVHDKTRKLGRQLAPVELRETIIDATAETRKAAGFGQLIVVVVFIPIFALTGIEGKMFEPMAAAFIFAIVGALIFSFTTAPALAGYFLTGKVRDEEPWLMQKFGVIYAPVLNFALRKKSRVILIAVICIALGGILFSRLGAEFLPQLDEGSIIITINRDVNIGLDASLAMQEKTEKLIKEFSEVEVTFAKLGTADLATDPLGVNSADTFIMLKDSKFWPKINGRRRTKNQLTEAIAERLKKQIPEEDFIVSQPIQERFNELLEGTRSDVTVKIFGEDMDTLLDISRKTEKLIESIPGSGEVDTEHAEPSLLLKIVPKNDMLNRLAVSNQAVLDTIDTALAGKEVGFLFEGTRKYPILIRLNEAQRSDLNVLNNLPVAIGPNITARLSDLADVQSTNGYGTIIREDSRRRSAILIDPRGRDTKSFVADAKQAIGKNITLPNGYYFEWGGNFKNLEEASARLMILTPVVLMLVLLMIYVVFKNIYQTLLIFSGIPLALIGGVVALKINGLPFSISAGIGFIALSGIAILNGVVLISYFNQLQAQGLSGEDLVKRGTALRLRPVLMTALVEICGFLPMMVSKGIGAEVQKPLATVVIGGVISSTLLTLVVLPTVYLLFETRMKLKPESSRI